MILAVEDQDFVADFYSELFKEKGYDIVTVANGEDALKEMEKEIPEVVILDILMPKMPGSMVLEKMRNNPKLAKVPVVVLSNLPAHNAPKEVDGPPVVEYVVKADIEGEEIIGIVERYLQ